MDALRELDLRSTGYLVGVVLSAIGFCWRIYLWQSNKAGRVPWVVAWSGLRNQPMLTSAMALARSFVKDLSLQTSARRKGIGKWLAHLATAWGFFLSTVISIALFFEWVTFRISPPAAYQVYIFRLPTFEFQVSSPTGFLLFNLLNFSALLLLIGVLALVFQRQVLRTYDPPQIFAVDWTPLLLILVVTVTGLSLTVSYRFFSGGLHWLIAIVHEVTVILMLLYLPYGKLFHLVQQPCRLALAVDKAAEGTSPLRCRECGQPLMSEGSFETVCQLARPESPLAFVNSDKISLCPRCRRRDFAQSAEVRKITAASTNDSRERAS